MDSEEEHEDHAGEEANPSTLTCLTGFLFGNIDEKGQLEEDFLDAESKKQLGSLSLLSQMVREITSDEQTTDCNVDKDDGLENFSAKAVNAVDFSDITEVADEDDEDKKIKEVMSSLRVLPPDDNEEDYDAAPKDSKLMPPPSWVPTGTPGEMDSSPSQTDDSKPKQSSEMPAVSLSNEQETNKLTPDGCIVTELSKTIDRTNEEKEIEGKKKTEYATCFDVAKRIGVC